MDFQNIFKWQDAAGNLYDNDEIALDLIGLIEQGELRAFPSNDANIPAIPADGLPRVDLRENTTRYFIDRVDLGCFLVARGHPLPSFWYEAEDVGIRLSDILAKDVVAIKLLGPVRFVTAGSPKYFDKLGRPKHPKDLLSHNCIRGRLGAVLYDRWEYEYKGKEFQVQVKGSLIVNDSLLMLDAALDGAGVTYTTEDAIRDEVRLGKLELVLNQFACSSTGFYLYYPKRSQVLPKLRAFIEHIKSENKLPVR